MLKKLRLKFIAINMVISTLLLCLVFGLIVYLTGSNLRYMSIQNMRSIASDPFSPAISSEQRTTYLLLQISPMGTVSFSGNGEFHDLDQQTMHQMLEAALKQGRTSGELDDYAVRFYRTSTPLGQSIVFTDISAEQATMLQLTQICIMVGIAAFLVLFIVSVLLARWAVKPVETAWTQQRQFVADASHELKTPLTVITTNAELLQDDACTPDTKHQLVSSILSMSRQLRGLTDSLLNLARIDNGTAHNVFSVVDLSLLASDTVLSFEALFFERGLNLRSSIQEDIQIKGNDTQIRQLIEIFLDNAQKYASPHTDILLALRQTDRTHCILYVSNLGDPIAPEGLPHLFERFYRADKARAMDQSYGLGLAIAKEITAIHKGIIWAESKDGVNSFCIQLPLA